MLPKGGNEAPHVESDSCHHQRFPGRNPAANFGDLIEEVRFAGDSPVEEDGFELSVPPERKAFPRAPRRADRHAAAARCLEPSLGSSMVNVWRDQWRSRRQRKQQR